MIEIYNSYSEKIEPVTDKKIGLYVCGVTPYDTTHLGHAFTFVTYDVLVRYLRFLGNDVTYVQNVTDIDDDILIKSKAMGTSWQELGKKETERHVANMNSLNALAPDHFPKATENIDEMIKIISSLLEKNLAYEKDGNVYYEVKKDKKFGKLSKYGYRAMLAIANDRGNFPLDPSKKDPLDFVLWQAQKEDEPSWESTWGPGRPGWHIECTAMSMKYLGPTITIHGGGEDLIFPHHEAEIAQSENYTGSQFVKTWMHTSMVYYEGKKMSKSLGNMIFISNLLKNYTPNTIRTLLLSHQYNLPWNFEESELETAAETAEQIEEALVESTQKPEETEKQIPDFFKSLNKDFNTPLALEVLKKTAVAGNNKEAVAKCAELLGFSF